MSFFYFNTVTSVLSLCYSVFYDAHCIFILFLSPGCFSGGVWGNNGDLQPLSNCHHLVTEHLMASSPPDSPTTWICTPHLLPKIKYNMGGKGKTRQCSRISVISLKQTMYLLCYFLPTFLHGALQSQARVGDNSDHLCSCFLHIDFGADTLMRFLFIS